MFNFFRKKAPEPETSSLPEGDDLFSRLRRSNTRFVRVAGPDDPRSVCGDWVGAILSVEPGDARFPALADAVADGLFHPGCRHRPVAFDPRVAAPEALREAIARTNHARAAMTRRQQGHAPPAVERAAEARPRVNANARGEFETHYAAARQADLSGDMITSLKHCEAALALLGSNDIFGEKQRSVHDALSARVRGLRKQAR